MKPGWRRFLDILRIAIGIGAKAARRPRVREGLEMGSDVIGGLVEEDQGPTARETPRGKGLR